MKTIGLSIVILLLAIGCSSDDTVTSQEFQPEPTGISSYDADLIPQKPDSEPNLLVNSDFETDSNWIFCGDAQRQETANTISGNQVAVLGTSSTCTEANIPFFTVRNAIMLQPLNLTALPNNLTISFWIRADATVPQALLNLYITNSRDRFFGSLAGGQSIVKYFDAAKIGNEWLQIKLCFENDGNNLFIDDNGPFALAFELESSTSSTENITIYIDDVKVSEQGEIFTHPDPLPEGLLNYEESNILFLNNTENVIATMRPNGNDVTNYPQIDRESLNSIPQWFGSSQFMAAQKTFNPQTTNDSEVIPASGTDLLRYNAENGSADLIYQTFGDPGRYSLTNTTNNKEATDIEIRRTNWDLARNRGAVTVCARSRSTVVTSDDFCNIVIIDSNDFSTINEDLEGFNAVWSSDGKLAYYHNNALYVAEISNGNVTTEVVHQGTSIGGLMQEVDWSPDGRKLVFAENVGGVTTINGQKQAMFTIMTLDITTNIIRPILNVDHGILWTNLSWSPDGNYILYTLNSDNSTAIWWLEVQTGKTGPLTNTINGSSGYWSK